MNIEEKLSRIEADIKEIRANFGKVKKGGRWLPEIGEAYYLLDIMGITETSFTTGKANLHIFERNNVYKTQEEAEKAGRIRMAKIRVLDIIAKHNDGWWPDWSDGNQQDKFYFHLSSYSDKVEFSCTRAIKSQPDSFHFNGDKISLIEKEAGDDIYALFDMEKGDLND